MILSYLIMKVFGVVSYPVVRYLEWKKWRELRMDAEAIWAQHQQQWILNAAKYSKMLDEEEVENLFARLSEGDATVMNPEVLI